MIHRAIKKDGAQTRARAAEIIASGGIIAFRTDTFYGLGVDPKNARSVRAVRELKGRQASRKPVLIVISDAEEAKRFVAVDSPAFEILIKRFWPGALTIIGHAKPDVPEELTAGTSTLGVRLPDDETVRGLVRACGGALTATSANPTGELPARTAAEVAHYFPGEIDLIVDGGETHALQPSTVVDVSASEARLVREGLISRRVLEETLRAIDVRLV